KEYRDSLLEAKTIKDVKKPDVAGFRVDPNEFTETQENPKPQGGIDLFQNVTFVETNNEGGEQVNNPLSTDSVAQAEPITLSGSPLVAMPEPVETSSPEATNPVNLASESSEMPAVSLIPSIESGNNQPEDAASSNQNQEITNPLDGLLLTPNTQPNQESSQIVNLLGTSSNPAIPPVTIESSSAPDVGKPDLLGQNGSIQSETSSDSSQSSEDFVNCPHCGAKVRNGSTKCFMCGKEL
ncbi:MAG: zinc ribbon domain-containing protein, partial [Bacilli bacterium]|nr:zinc ribbon domain-containing protein [Bacilli bacterium]